MTRLAKLIQSNLAIISLAAAAGLISFMLTATADEEVSRPKPQVAAGYETAIVAGGCFWCVEADFDKLGGVIETVSGYAGGTVENPTYQQVTYGDTGHYEAVQVTYDPSRVSYGEIVEYFWRHVDPTDAGGQFCDRGDSYRTAIFAVTPEQRDIAEMSKTALESAGILPGPVVTPVLDAGTFWPAEDYHQDYHQKNRLRYSYYRNGCGRDARIRDVWKDAAPLSLEES